MKDLFVELASLHGTLGTASETAVTLRTAMLGASARETALEQKLREQLLQLSTAARALATDIQDRKIGINFTDEELAPANSRPTHRKKSGNKTPRPRAPG